MPKVDINRDLCNGCRACSRVCPVNVFDIRDGKSYATRAEFCMACGLCEVECPVKAIAVNRPVPVGAAAPGPRPVSQPMAAASPEPMRPAAFEPRPAATAVPPAAGWPTAASAPPGPAATPPAAWAPGTPPSPAPSWPSATPSPAPAPVWPAAQTAASIPPAVQASSWSAAASAPPTPSAPPAWPTSPAPAAPSPTAGAPAAAPPAWPSAPAQAAPPAPPAWPPAPAPAAPAQPGNPPAGGQEAGGWGYFGGTVVARGQQTPAIDVPAAPPAATVLTQAPADGQARKLFVAIADLCSGCRLCEMACALKHTGTFNPYRAAIKVTQVHEEALFIPNICRHCKNPPACQRACPVAAITTDPRTNVAVLDHSKCINCLNCVYACPFGAIPVGPNGEVYKCDLCGGDPLCVKYCPKNPAQSTPYHPYPRASCLQYVDPNDVTLMRRMADAEKKKE